MSESQSKSAFYAMAGICALALLIFLGWLVLREPPRPSERPPVRAVIASPRVRSVESLSTPNEEAAFEPLTNQVVGSAMNETNAAVIYGQAFAMFDALSKEQKDLLGDWHTNLDASVEAELCAAIQPICDLLHQAAAVSNCDWGLEQPITFNTRLPHLNHCRSLARTAAWSVAHCRNGDPTAAIDDLVAASQLGQDASSPPILIGHLVNLAVQGIVIDSVAEHASTLLRTGDTRLMQLLQDANYRSILPAVAGEEADVLSREADLLATLPPEGVRQELAAIDNSPSSKFSSLEPAELVADMREAADLQRQYAQALDLPEAEFRTWLSNLDEVAKTNPFVEDFVTGLGKTFERTEAATVRTAMAAAGLAVMHSGPSALQSYPDPSTGQPFAYTQTSAGFDLQSSFVFRDKPVKLSFQ